MHYIILIILFIMLKIYIYYFICSDWKQVARDRLLVEQALNVLYTNNVLNHLAIQPPAPVHKSS